MIQTPFKGFKNQKELAFLMSSTAFVFARVDLPGLWFSYVR